MKNAVVFSFARIYETSMVASQRIALLVSQELGVPLITDLNIKKDVPRRLDNLLIVNGAYAFCRCLPALGALIEQAQRVIWIQQDYIILPPKPDGNAESPFRLAFRKRAEAGKSHIDYWTTCRDNVRKTPLGHYINWNALTFDLASSDKIVSERRLNSTDDLLYYGSWRDQTGRKTRLPYFDRYFKAPKIPVTISSPLVKGKNKFAEKYPLCTHVDKIEGNLYDALGRHGSGLYLEDRMSHEEYHSPPNRFYEMLSAGLPIIFQPECGSTLRTAGYDPTPYQASNPVALARLHAERDSVGREQRSKWIGRARDDHDAVIPALHEAAKKLGS